MQLYTGTLGIVLLLCVVFCYHCTICRACICSQW